MSDVYPRDMSGQVAVDVKARQFLKTFGKKFTFFTSILFSSLTMEGESGRWVAEGLVATYAKFFESEIFSLLVSTVSSLSLMLTTMYVRTTYNSYPTQPNPLHLFTLSFLPSRLPPSHFFAPSNPSKKKRERRKKIKTHPLKPHFFILGGGEGGGLWFFFLLYTSSFPLFITTRKISHCVWEASQEKKKNLFFMI